MLRNAAIRGLLAGLAEVAAMTAAEKVEQLFTILVENAGRFVQGAELQNVVDKRLWF